MVFMRTQFAMELLPEWAEGLSEEVVRAVRQEAIRRGVPSTELVKEGTLRAARHLALDTLPGTMSRKTTGPCELP